MYPVTAKETRLWSCDSLLRTLLQFSFYIRLSGACQHRHLHRQTGTTIKGQDCWSNNMHAQWCFAFETFVHIIQNIYYQKRSKDKLYITQFLLSGLTHLLHTLPEPFILLFTLCFMAWISLDNSKCLSISVIHFLCVIFHVNKHILMY